MIPVLFAAALKLVIAIILRSAVQSGSSVEMSMAITGALLIYAKPHIIKPRDQQQQQQQPQIEEHCDLFPQWIQLKRNEEGLISQV